MGKAKNKRKSASTHASPGPKRSKKMGKTPNKEINQPVATPLVDDSTFGQMVKQAGFVLMSGDFPNELSIDQVMFNLNLSKALKHSADLKQVIEEFTTWIQNHIEDPVRFKYSLLPTTTAADCESARSGSQDSLMRLLLGIDELQPSLVNVLLEKLPEFMEDQDSMFDYTEASNLPRLILNHFRWLDAVLNSKEMADKMLEMVSVSSDSVKQEIISCIPEVISDNEHNSVATKLQELLLSSSELTVPILDALTNLNLTTDLMIEVRNAALQTLVSAELEDHPVIIKFILQSVSKNDANEVISRLRDNLEFTASVPTRSTSTQQRGSSSKTNDSTLLILDSIKTNMRFQKVVTKGWITAIENVPTASEHKVVDIFILLIAHFIAANQKKTVESLFRAKVRSGFFKEDLLEAAFSSNAQGLREYFPSILSLANVLLRSPEESVSLFACSIYRQAFRAFDTCCKHEVIGSIVAHIGSGLEGEVEAGLDVLLSLVEHNASEVAPFTIFIKCVLDYLANLSMQQIRKLFSILATLAFRNVNDNTAIQDELHIVIRKQLSNNNPKYKRIGVIGSLMIVRNMAYYSGADLVDQEKELSNDRFKGVKTLIELVRSSSNRMPEASALFLDELAIIIEERQLHPQVAEYIGDTFMNDFQDDFVVDIQADNVSGNYCLPLKEEFGLEAEESQGGVAINLLPLVSKAERAHLNLGSMVSEDSESERTQTVFPLCMPSHFRLLRICEQVQHNGDLEGIDALLGCPLYTVDNEVFSKVASLSRQEREMLCTCLFLTVNWFREVVNAFSGLTDPDMRGKVLARLCNITEVQKHIQTCLEETPDFIPPMATFDSESSQSMSPSGKRGRKTKEKKKSAAVSLDDSITGHSSTQNATIDTTQSRSPEQEASGNGKVSSVDLAQYRKHFRELDIEVFNILGYGQVSRRVLDSDLHTQEEVVLHLQPPELHILLEDLSLKLDHALVAHASKRWTFLKTRGDKNAGFTRLNRFTPRQIAKRTVKLLPHLCKHLESTSSFFQALTAQNDGLLDGPGSHTPEYDEMVSCLHLLLKCLLSLFSWNGFQSSENKTVFEEALKVLTARTKSSRRSQVQLHNNAFTYLEKFMDTVPDLASAVLLLRLLVSLDELSDSSDNRKKLAGLSEGLLKREWLGPDGQREKGAKFNELLKRLIKIYLSHTPDTLKSIQDLCTVGIQELMSTEDRKGGSTTYPTLHRASFGIFYRIMFEHVIISIRNMCYGKASVGPRMTEQRLIRWTMASRVFQILISMLKEFDARNNLSSALKYGRQFIELFLRQGMPLLDKLFPNHRDDVLALFKTLQPSTRSLHHICGHSKVAKDVSLTTHVPAMKRNLELIMYRVKAMLTLHKCHEAFWVGNLKNRDLQGEEILSQQTNDSGSEAGDDEVEESVLSDDSNSDGEESTATNDQEKCDSDEESYSECF